MSHSAEIAVYLNCTLNPAFFVQFMTLPSQWFSRRRGLATGITVSGTGFGGGVYSLIMRAILPKLGYRNSLFVREDLVQFVSELRLIPQILSLHRSTPESVQSSTSALGSSFKLEDHQFERSLKVSPPRLVSHPVSGTMERSTPYWLACSSVYLASLRCLSKFSYFSLHLTEIDD